MTKYAIINITENTAIKIGFCNDEEFTQLKYDGELADINLKYVDIGISQFPINQNWSKNADNFLYPPLKIPMTFAKCKSNVLKMVRSNTENIVFSGTMTYLNDEYSMSHDSQIHYSEILSAKNILTENSFPISIPKANDENEYLQLLSVLDVEAFCSAVGGCSMQKWNAGIIEETKINGFTTIEQVILYFDSRV